MSNTNDRQQPAPHKTSSPTTITDKTRRVSICPVAHQLSRRKSRNQNWLAYFALALAVLAVGWIVRVAIENSDLLSGARAPDHSVQEESPTVIKSDIDRIHEVAGSQVRSVIELVDAFEHLATQDRENKNPLALPNASPTAPVAFFETPQDSPAETQIFLAQIHTPTEQAENASQEQPSQEQPAQEQPRNDAEEVRAPIVLAPTVDASEIVQHADDIVLQPTPRSQTASEQASVVDDPVPAVAALEADVVLALENYENALLALDDTSNRKASRNFYAALADLAQAGYLNGSSDAAASISGIYTDPKLYELTSAAAASWVTWPKRQSPGVVVAGKLESVTDHPGGYMINIRTSDRRSSVISVLVDRFEFDFSEMHDVVVAGVITEEIHGDSPLILGQMVAAN